jgi:hypothetical protein
MVLLRDSLLMKYASLFHNHTEANRHFQASPLLHYGLLLNKFIATNIITP